MESHLKNKSDILQSAAQLLHDKSMYPAVPHNAYYSCYQLLKHIWIKKLNKSEAELDSLCSSSKLGSHEVLINEIGAFIKGLPFPNAKADFRDFNTDIVQLKKHRIDADYKNTVIDTTKSSNSISLSQKIISILKKYRLL